ncbi:poly-gamma-glutamate biosynthesis protein PgsC/CapC [Nocardioides aurantiacus]|uniref:poly-gamma-glutamate biosynthesis protein PgsC/CapC n=1 Tax=Nocardioides aurantiacus TaxID=86796 RepID=UPI00403FB0D7
MHDYLLRPEVARIALVFGVVVSILFYERVQLTTGGAIVPAYLTMFLAAPLYVVSTLVIAYLTFVLVNKVIAKRWIIYGRRKFEVEMLVGLALVTLMTLIGLGLSQWDPLLFGVAGIGMLIPGVIAHDMFRQKPHKTLLAVGATTAIVAAFVYLFASLLDISPFVESRLPRVADDVGYPNQLLLLGAVTSVLAGLLVFSKLGLRSGGFVSAAYLALFVVRPYDLLWSAVLAVVIWLIVTRLVMPNLLVFGRRKLSTMILVGAVVTWSAEIVAAAVTDGAFQPWRGLVLMSLMIPALLANDAQRQGLERTAWGTAISTLIVFGTMNVLEAGLLAGGAL